MPGSPGCSAGPNACVHTILETALCSAGKGPDATLQIDLKGALYDARLAPCAATLAIVNLGPSEAKVELLTNQFLQLDRVNSDDDQRQHFLWDDQDADLVSLPVLVVGPWRHCVCASVHGTWHLTGMTVKCTQENAGAAADEPKVKKAKAGAKKPARRGKKPGAGKGKSGPGRAKGKSKAAPGKAGVSKKEASQEEGSR